MGAVMSDHDYTPSHGGWCIACRDKARAVDGVLMLLERDRARKRLHAAADSLAAEPGFWEGIEADLTDSDLPRIAALFTGRIRIGGTR